MFSHQTLGSNDIERSKRFYDALIGAIGGGEGMVDPKGRLVYLHGGALLILTRPIDGQPATHGNGSTLGFAMAGPDQVETWHAAGLAHGGTAIEDPPGWRMRPTGRLYLAYLRDPDGNKLCAVFREKTQ